MGAIPRKLVFRVLAELLSGHAAEIESRTVGSIRRRDALPGQPEGEYSADELRDMIDESDIDE